MQSGPRLPRAQSGEFDFGLKSSFSAPSVCRVFIQGAGHGGLTLVMLNLCQMLC